MMKNKSKSLLIAIIAILIITGIYLVKFQLPLHTSEQLNISEQPRIKEKAINYKSEQLNISEQPRIKEKAINYKYVTEKPNGWFETGQEADIMLSGVDFNNTGGALLFNHPKGIASDGKRLVLADTYNNRILIWNSLPEGNEEPDLVLGQKNFVSNNPGDNLDELNWPVGVATDGKKLLVADTYNDRILIWNSFPTQNGQKADLILQGDKRRGIDKRGNILWPWAVWTDGNKVVIASTGSGQILIWNSFPTKNNQPADIIIKLPEFGTPRSIGSDGKYLVVGDHNAPGGRGTFIWKEFPTRNDQKYDFLLTDPEKGLTSEPENEMSRQMLWSTFDDKGRFIALGARIYIWNEFPNNENDAPDYIIGTKVPSEKKYYFYEGGDGSDLVSVGEKLYLVLSNENKIIGFSNLPTKMEDKPDFAIGSSDIYTNTLETNYFITNPVPVTDGKSLFVSSDYDQKLYIWKKLPAESGAKPDLVYSLPEPVWDGDTDGEVLVFVGGPSLYLWRELPLNGEKPEVYHSFGNVQFQGLSGVAIDDKYFYLADMVAHKIYIWKGIPKKDEEPVFILNVEKAGRLSSDGKFLTFVDTFGQRIGVYRLAEIESNPEPIYINKPLGENPSENGINGFNLPQDAIIWQGSLFVADTNFNRVIIWNSVDDAISGRKADIILGEENFEDTTPEIGKNKLFWPSGLAFDGSFLWVGEFKFSGRLLRYSVR